MFAKLTQFLTHGRELASHILALAEKGITIDAGILAKAEAFDHTARNFIPKMEASPVTVVVPVAPEHAATLGVK